MRTVTIVYLTTWLSSLGGVVLISWELVLTVKGEALAAWASVPSAWEIPAYGGMTLSPRELVPLIACELPARTA